MTERLIRTAAMAAIHLAIIILPAPIRHWGAAIRHEAMAIDRPGAALLFTLGFLGFAIRHAIVWHLFRPLGLLLVAISAALPPLEHKDMSMFAIHPRRMIAGCAIVSTILGLAYLTLAGAPFGYLASNMVALATGFAVVGVATWFGQAAAGKISTVTLMLGCILLVTSIFGITVEGATRWISLAGIVLQPSLVIVPLMVLCFARQCDARGVIGIVIAAIAIAFQPDRAMAAALVAAMLALAIVRMERAVLVALGVSCCALLITMISPERQSAMPFVDQILFSAFSVHVVAGLIVIAGSAFLLMPAMIGLWQDEAHRDYYAVFAAVWGAIVAAALLGNYPTPLVGYGGSAIIGYVVSLLGMPRQASLASKRQDGIDVVSGRDRHWDDLRLAGSDTV